jgi:hypothetical protein
MQYAVLEHSERHAMLLPKIEKTRIGQESEGLFLKTVKGFVHAYVRLIK